MHFELLPNEILLDCFKYLNGVHLFHAFDQLNYRINQLIRSIPLHMTFENIPQSVYIQFCKKIQSNQKLKNQIYSIHLSNENTCYPIQLFITTFALNEFIHLRSLILTKITIATIQQLKTMVPLITKLSFFHLTDSSFYQDNILSILPSSYLQKLIIPQFPSYLYLNHRLSTIRNLTISECTLCELYQILKSASSLNYLKIGCIRNDQSNTNENTYSDYVTNVKKLIIMNMNGEFHDIVNILKRTPDLQSFIVSVHSATTNSINAYQWEDFITFSLPYLNNFKFIFECPFDIPSNNIHAILSEFQSDFWIKQHHWYTKYSLSDNLCCIYTIPYISKTYCLKPNTYTYSNQSTSNLKIYDNVKDLVMLSPLALLNKCPLYFPNVTSLDLRKFAHVTDCWPFNLRHIDCLKTIVNLSNIKHLNVLSCKSIGVSSALLYLFKEAPRISSIVINSYILKICFITNELHGYLIKMITKLKIVNDFTYVLDTIYSLRQLCNIFSNLEELSCCIHTNSLLFLLKHLPKLVRLNVSTNSLYSTHVILDDERVNSLGLTIYRDVTYDTVTYYYHLFICRNQRSIPARPQCRKKTFSFCGIKFSRRKVS